MCVCVHKSKPAWINLNEVLTVYVQTITWKSILCQRKSFVMEQKGKRRGYAICALKVPIYKKNTCWCHCHPHKHTHTQWPRATNRNKRRLKRENKYFTITWTISLCKLKILKCVTNIYPEIIFSAKMSRSCRSNVTFHLSSSDKYILHS